MSNLSSPADPPVLLDLLDKAVKPAELELVQKILLGIWAQWEGRGLRGVTENLLATTTLERQRLSTLDELSASQQGYSKDLEEWNNGLAILQQAIDKFEEENNALVSSWFSKVSAGKHPLSGHGYTSNGLYSAAWNRHEVSDDTAPEWENYRKLQWWWVRVQCLVISTQNIKWEAYRSNLESKPIDCN